MTGFTTHWSETAVTITTAMFQMTLSELRHLRRVLKSEQATVSRWRRLVRARLDLAIASVALPDPLAERAELAAVAVLTGHDLPTFAELAGDVFSPCPSTEVALLEHLRAHDRGLAQYQAGIAAALERATSEFIRRIAADPAAVLRATDDDPEQPPAVPPAP